MSNVLITGANRGLGLEFARQYEREGWRVFACCRHPHEATDLQALAAESHGQLSLHALEVSDHSQIEALAWELRDEPLDVLLNNAGIYGARKMVLGQIDYQQWADVLAVNVLAPLKMVECFLDNVARSQRKVIACISSAMGSMALNTDGRHYLYRSSKAALNCVVKSLAIDLRDRHIIAVAINPGWVQTDMGGPNADLTPAESIAGMRQVLGRLRLADSGKFLSYDGSEVPW
jgi:NAD(P)-dependent dehydrogenase (short-subunit alcohol dehydrogenase family)